MEKLNNLDSRAQHTNISLIPDGKTNYPPIIKGGKKEDFILKTLRTGLDHISLSVVN